MLAYLLSPVQKAVNEAGRERWGNVGQRNICQHHGGFSAGAFSSQSAKEVGVIWRGGISSSCSTRKNMEVS